MITSTFIGICVIGISLIVMFVMNLIAGIKMIRSVITMVVLGIIGIIVYKSLHGV